MSAHPGAVRQLAAGLAGPAGKAGMLTGTTFMPEGVMAAKEVSKKKYLKILNKRLRAEPDAPAGVSFVFYPPGAKAKHATGVVSSEPRSKRELAMMAAIQRKAAEEFVVTGA